MYVVGWAEDTSNQGQTLQETELEFRTPEECQALFADLGMGADAIKNDMMCAGTDTAECKDG
eukprot:scaffold55462_cov45-Prasinocladus_malaysianus.AAC.1